MSPERLEEWLRCARRRPLHADGPSARTVGAVGAGLHRFLPHRDPFLLLDEVVAFDPAARTVLGRRRVRADDPVLAGHFPGDPVYPGVLLVEVLGQLSLCLAHCLAEADGPPPQVRAVRILHAVFLEPVRPGDQLTLCAADCDEGGLTTIAIGQVYAGDTLCTVAVQEVYHVE